MSNAGAKTSARADTLSAKTKSDWLVLRALKVSSSVLSQKTFSVGKQVVFFAAARAE